MHKRGEKIKGPRKILDGRLRGKMVCKKRNLTEKLKNSY